MGMHGWKHVNRAIQSADLLIALGMRFDDRVTGNVSTYAPNARIVHVDIDPSEIGKNVAVDVPIVGDVGRVLRALTPLMRERTADERAAYFAQLAEWRADSEGASWHGSGAWRDGLLSADYVISRLGELTDHDANLSSRRRPAPDVAGPLRRLPATRLPHLVGRPGHDGLRRCRPPWARRSVGRTRSPGRSSVTAASR